MLDKTRKALVEKFLNAIIVCVGEKFNRNVTYQRVKAKRVCQFSRYSALMLFLMSVGIEPGQTSNYGGSIQGAMAQIRLIPKDVERFKSEKAILRGEPCVGGDRCKYCSRNILQDMLKTCNDHARKLPGIRLRCFLGDEEDYLTTRKCKETFGTPCYTAYAGGWRNEY